MFHGRCAITGPGQAKVIAREIVAGFLVFPALGLECFGIKQVHVAHVRFQALRALTGIPNGP